MADLIKPGRVWQPMQGLRFGLQQRSVLGTVKVDTCAVHGLRLLESALWGYVDEPLPPPTPGQDANERLIRLFAFAYVAILRSARIPSSDAFHSQARRTQAGQAVTFDLCLPAPSFEAGPIALEWAAGAFNRLLRPLEDKQLETLRAMREAVLDRLQPFSTPGVNAFCIRLAAYRLRVPVTTFDKWVLQLGTGSHSRLMDSSLTDAAPAIGVRMARFKHETARVLLASGLPGGVHELAPSSAAAAECAARLGYPVVVKPDDMEKGAGVSADLRDEEAVRAAWDAARKVSPNVLVEKWAPGFTHRLAVFNGHVIRVSRRIAGGVTGNGTNSVAELVSLVQEPQGQQRALRRQGERRLTLDDEALGLLIQEGRDASYVPAAGEFVRLRRRDNMNAGGSTESVPLDQVHPDNLRLALDAARLLRLDFAGVDLIMRDIAASWLEAGALICEVNAQPQMAARTEPELWNRVVSELVGPCSRVPARLLIVPDDLAREGAIVRRLASEEPGTSVSSRSGLWIAGRQATLAFTSGYLAAQALFRRTDVRAATCLMTLAELERMGLPMDQWTSIASVVQPEPGSEQDRRLRAAMVMTRAHVKATETERES